MRYKILVATKPDDLSRQVNTALADGWTLVGGVSVALNGSPTYGDLVFAQAIARVEVKHG